MSTKAESSSTSMAQHSRDHLQKSHLNPSCEFCNNLFNSVNELNVHKLYECDKITEWCALKDFGCSTLVIRAQKWEHYKTEQHQAAIMTFIRHAASKYPNNSYNRGSTMDVDIPSHTTMSSFDSITMQLQEACQTLDILSDGVSTLNEDRERLNRESNFINNRIESLTSDFARLKLSIEEKMTCLDELKRNQEILDQEIASSKQKMDDMQNVSYDGTLFWKITNVSSKIADAKSKRQTSIYSPPFFSSHTGYKMRARLYFNGDGNAHHTHISLFFILMRGEYDAILKFPFNYKVIFCLFDQTPKQQHIIDSFLPNTKSNSFQRPQSEINIASGLPKFCQLSIIQADGNGYIRDDTMFIKIMVDFDDLSENLLRFVLGLNPGFPINIQQAIIKQESEKQIQQTST
ncbi:unnamed protein product [Rotaria sordida]|uniref:MATH domain-containing protein n=1 Tax=Rotaria sordida TaxID=392033 RepID=A0A815B2Z9_9BILA|nr:unnamed protein product [Rotaria sordida]